MDKSTARRTGGPLDAKVVLRRPSVSLRYWFGRRWADASAGWRDGVVDLRGLTGPDEDGRLRAEAVASRKWLDHNEATYRERDSREYLEALAGVAGPRVRLGELAAAARAAEAEVERARAGRTALDGELTEEELQARGPAEGHANDAVVAMRRRNEHEYRRRVAGAVVDQTEARARAVTDEQARLVAVLEAAFEAAVTRSARLRAFHTRRAEVFLRAWRRVVLRRHPDPSTLSLSQPSEEIPAPEWTTGPCPWIRTGAPVHPALHRVS